MGPAEEAFPENDSPHQILGEAYTSAQAKRLDALGFTYDDLLKLRLDKGVNSKPLREKLAKQLQR